MAGTNTITLTLTPSKHDDGSTKAGDWAFRHDVPGTAYLTRNLFLKACRTRDTMPRTLVITCPDGDVFRVPHHRDPEATAKQIAQLDHRRSRKEHTAQAAQEAADALRHQADTLRAALDDFEG
jgi:hypothetical protein